MFKNKNILVTGATGSFGKKFIETLVKNKANLKKLIIFSRDELKQSEMQKHLPEKKFKQLRYFLGDVRDKERLKFAVREVNIIVHAAALKQVPTAEYNPIEYIKTNIIGAQNIIECALENKNIQKVLALSTDKAVSPVNLYGATKLCSDKLFLSANLIKGNSDLKFSILRYGNVMMSRGSVIPIFLKTKKNYFEITHKDMTRFSLTLEDGVNSAVYSLNHMQGGEIFIPKAKSYKILDLAKAINPQKKLKIIGIRPGEKIHETLISQAESLSTYEKRGYFIINSHGKENNYKKLKKVNDNFVYSSNQNSYMSINELKKIIKDQFNNQY